MIHPNTLGSRLVMLALLGCAVGPEPVPENAFATFDVTFRS